MRKTTPPEQLRALTDANAGLQALKAQLERSIEALETKKILLEQKIKLLEVTVTILLACTASLSTGLAIRMVGAKFGSPHLTVVCWDGCRALRHSGGGPSRSESTVPGLPGNVLCRDVLDRA
jgi:exonuclease VII small subunit